MYLSWLSGLIRIEFKRSEVKRAVNEIPGSN